MNTISRRRLMTALAILGAKPSIALSQPRAKTWRIAFVETSTAATWRTVVEGFKKAFRDYGYSDGMNYHLEEHYASAETELPQLARRIVAGRPDVILTWSSAPTLAIKQATKNVPVVFMSSGDPVGWGLVESLSRPGGNLTGVSNLLHEMTPKQLDLLHEAFPHITRVALLMDRTYPSHRAALAALEAHAPRLGITLHRVNAASEEEIQQGFEIIARQKAQAVLVMNTPLVGEQRGKIASLAQRTGIPCVGDAQRGWVLGYWAAYDEAFQRAAELVHKILRGAKPAELPVVQPARFRLTVDLEAARGVGLEIPQSILVRADRVFP